MYYQGGVLPQSKTAFFERRRPHHALRIVAESAWFRGDAIGTRIQHPVSVQVLEEGKSIGTFGQTAARHGNGLVLHLHTKTREGFLQEIIRRGIEGDIEKALRTVDVAYFEGQALGLHSCRTSYKEKSGEENHCFCLHTINVLITLQTYALILRKKNKWDRQQGYVTKGDKEGRTETFRDEWHADYYLPAAIKACTFLTYDRDTGTSSAHPSSRRRQPCELPSTLVTRRRLTR